MFERASVDVIGLGFGVIWTVDPYRISFTVAAVITDHITDADGTVDTRPHYHLRGASDGMDMTPDMGQADIYVEGCISWDGCSEVTFDPEGLHLCGRGCWQDHVALMAWLWRRAGELLTGKVEGCEDFKPLALAPKPTE